MSDNKEKQEIEVLDFDMKDIKRKKNRRLFLIGLLGIIVILFLFLLIKVFLGGSSKEVEDMEVDFTSERTEEDIQVEDQGMKLEFIEVELGELNESSFLHKRDKFDVFFSNDKKVEEYGFYRDEQQTELIIVPLSTKFDVEIESIEMNNKEITVRYNYGNPKIPRMVGHETKFEAKAYIIDFRSIESAIYELTLINEREEEHQQETLDFTKPFYRSTWQVENLTWGEEDQLVFASNIDGNWELYAYNINQDDEPIKLTDRHSDYDLHTLTTLGVENINIPKPMYSNKTDKILYHANQDIYEVKTNGRGNHPKTILNEEYPIEEGMINFDNEPVPTNSGDYIFYRKILDPQHSELWRMYYNGKNNERVMLPEDSYIEEYIVSPKDDQLAVLLSSRESELRNGHSNLWILSLKDENEEPKKITTVGYKVQDIDFSPNNKTIAFSMKENATTSELLTDIWTVNSNNTDLTRLTPKDNYMDIKPVWSPDGSKIAFLSGDGSKFHLAIMNKDGENRRIVDNRIRVNGKPLWSNDGKDVFIADIRGNIFKYNLEEDKVYLVLEGY